MEGFVNANYDPVINIEVADGGSVVIQPME